MKKNHNIIILIIVSIIVIIISITGIFKKDKIDNNFKNNLHTETKRILQKLEDKIYVNIYLNGKISPKCKELQSATIDLLNQFKLHSNKEIDFSLVETEELESDTLTGIYSPLKDLNIFPIFIKEKEETFKVYPYATIHYNERTLKFPIVLIPPSISESFTMRNETINELTDKELKDAINQLEYKFIESIYLLQQKKRKRVALLQGNEELNPIYTADIHNTLSKYYNVHYLDINIENNPESKLSPIERTNKQMNMINSYDAIIIAKPKKELHDQSIYFLDQYIMNGGRVMWLIDGTNAADWDNWAGREFEISKKELRLNQILETYGAKISHDLIQDKKCTKNIFITGYNQGKYEYENWQYNPILGSKDNHLINSNKDSILTHFVSSIKILDSSITTILLSSSKESNIKKIGDSVTCEIVNNPPSKFVGEQIVSVLIEDEFNSFFNKESIINGINYKSKSKKNKMILISDGDIIANKFNPSKRKPIPLGLDLYSESNDKKLFRGNTNFILNAILYLCDDEVLIKIKYNK